MKRSFGLSQDLDVITIRTRKENNKVNQAEKGAPADFLSELMWLKLMLLLA